MKQVYVINKRWRDLEQHLKEIGVKLSTHHQQSLIFFNIRPVILNNHQIQLNT